MKSKFSLTTSDNEAIEFAETEHDARMAYLTDGRPIDFGPASIVSGYCRHDWLLVIWYDTGAYHCEIGLTNADLGMNDKEFKERIILPCINNLDAVAYPDRWDRWHAALKTYTKHLAEKCSPSASPIPLN